MNLTKIAAQNLLRRKNRSIILILSVLIGVGSVLFLYLSSRAMTEDIANKLDQYGSNILILPEAGESLTFGGVTVDSPAKIQELSPELIPLMKTIKNNETLATIAPKLLANTTLNNYDVLLLGVDFTQELRLKKWWKIDGLNKRQIPKENQILLGTEVASRLN
nr:ABC transporter permease [Desulfitobacterium hafniense]